MDPTSNEVLRATWLDALRRERAAREARLYERPPFNPAVRVLSCRALDASSAQPDDARVHIEGQGPRPAGARLELEFDDASDAIVVEPPDVVAGVQRWDDQASPPPSLLVSSLLHDLKNALGAQSLLLGSAERELRTASDGSRSVRFEPLLESLGLCRESVAIAADRAQVAQWISSTSAAPSMSGELWLRLALAALSSDERDRLQRTLSPDARSGPRGDVRSLVAIACALCAMASGGTRSGQPTASLAELRCDDEQLTLSLSLAHKCVSLDVLWSAATQQQPASGSRSEALIGLHEALCSRERFTFTASPSSGTSLVLHAPRSSGVLR